MKQEITRKDGIVYERQAKEINLDCKLNIRFKQENINKFKEIADKQGIRYNVLIRNILEDYLEKNY